MMPPNDLPSDRDSFLYKVGVWEKGRMWTVGVHVKTWSYRYTPAKEEVEHESALPHQRVNEYNLLCVGSDSYGLGEEQLQIFKMPALRWV